MNGFIVTEGKVLHGSLRRACDADREIREPPCETQGKKHQINLARRQSKEKMLDATVAPVVRNSIQFHVGVEQDSSTSIISSLKRA